MKKKLSIAAFTAAGALALVAAPADAGHEHFVVIDNPVDGTTTCQYIGSGQTSISDADHGGYHRIHDNVHAGRPGSDANGTDVDKHDNLSQRDCDTVRGR